MNISPVDTRLNGTPVSRFLQELFGNSLQFPIANVLLELLIEGKSFLADPALYTMPLAGIVQAYFLSRWQVTDHPCRLLGNLIGPAIYSGIEISMEGLGSFVNSPNHLAYLIFALIFGAMQELRPHLKGFLRDANILIEDAARASILPLMYLIFEIKTNPAQTVSAAVFFSDPSHVFIAIVSILLGLSIGLSNINAQRYLTLLRETSAQLKTYSEWLFGRDLLNLLMADPNALTLKRIERTVMFMDIRGFTRWSEARTPEEVANMLNRYYQTAEATLNQHNVIKFKLAADEVLAIFPAVDDGLNACLQLRMQIGSLLARHNLSVGIGLHHGSVVEGLLGSKEVRFYDVIGDTVNTAQRIEKAAGPGEVLISETVRLALGQTFRAKEKRQLSVKGKEEPLTVFVLE
jgi:class 3 adenylate cyclase